MRQVIEGKLYDTETAESIHYWSNYLSQRDFGFRSKELFKTKKGNYFLFHVGGPKTDMARSTGSNTWSGSESIEPISEEEVLKFLEKHEGTEVIVERFKAYEEA